MSAPLTPPVFGGKLQNPSYYSSVLSILRALRPQSSLCTMADELNRSGFTTPTGLPFNRERVRAFLRNS